MAADQSVDSLDGWGLIHGAIQSSRGHDYLNRYERLLRQLDPQTVVIVADAVPVGLVRSLRGWSPETHIHVLTLVAGAETGAEASVEGVVVEDLSSWQGDRFDQIHRILAGIAAIDILIDTTTARSDRRLLFWTFFAAVRDGGAYVAENLYSGDLPAFRDDNKLSLWGLVNRLVEWKSRPSGHTDMRPREQRLAEALGSIETDGRLLVAWRAGRTWVKVSHDDIEEVSQRRGLDLVEVVDVRPGMTVRPEAIVFHNAPEHQRRTFPSAFEVPDIPVRAYRDVVVSPRQVVRHDDMLLPDTFRLGHGRLRTKALREVGLHYAWARADAEPIELPGSFYYLDLEYNGHFGHFLTEGITRLHGWDAAKRADPDLRLLAGASTPEGDLRPFQYQLLAAYGIERSDVTVFDRPSRVQRLVSARSMFLTTQFVHTDLAATYERLSRGLLALRSAPTPGPEKIFVGRQPGLWRECIQAEALEAWFVERGFVVVRPEQHSLPDQAALFDDARVVAGYIGSALYGAMFSQQPIDLVTFVNESYLPTNEYLISVVRRHRMHYFVGSDVVGHRTRDIHDRLLAPYNHDYDFDVSVHGAALAAVVDAIA